MARTRKTGLEYFPLDVDMFGDIKIRKLIRKRGGQAVTVYTLLLCFIYRNGYYLTADEDLPFLVAEQTGFEEDYIQSVIDTCVDLGLFSKTIYEAAHVLTSESIQERYRDICKNSNHRACGITDYAIEEPVAPTTQTDHSAGEIPQNTPDNDHSAENFPQNTPISDHSAGKTPQNTPFCGENPAEYPKIPAECTQRKIKGKEKEKKKKENIFSPSSACAREARASDAGKPAALSPPPPRQAPPQPPHEDDWAAELIADRAFVQTLAMQTRAPDEETIRQALRDFAAESRAKQTYHADHREYRRHAYDWVRRHLEILKQQHDNAHTNTHADTHHGESDNDFQRRILQQVATARASPANPLW